MKNIIFLLVCFVGFAQMGFAQAEKVFTLESAQIMSKKKNGKKWDFGFKNTGPDVFVTISTLEKVKDKEKWVEKFKSTLKKDTLQPTWKEVIALQIKPKMKILVKVLDKDFRNNDLIGSRIIDVPGDNAKEIVITGMNQVEKLIFSWRVPAPKKEEKK